MFNLDVSLGNVLTILAIVLASLKMMSYLRRFDRLIWEHELMWSEYAKTHELPIRPRKTQ